MGTRGMGVLEGGLVRDRVWVYGEGGWWKSDSAMALGISACLFIA